MTHLVFLLSCWHRLSQCWTGTGLLASFTLCTDGDIFGARTCATAGACARKYDGADVVMIERLFLSGDAGDGAPVHKVDGVFERLCLLRYFAGAGNVEGDGCASNSVALSDDEFLATILGMLE